MTTKQKMNTYKFSENNSGGSWWLKRKQYDALFAAGWTYEPDDYDKENSYDTKPWLGEKGDTVPYGWRHGLKFKAATIRKAVESWEAATKEDFFSQGCNCCGSPFSMSLVDAPKGKYEYLNGNSVERTTVRPW